MADYGGDAAPQRKRMVFTKRDPQAAEALEKERQEKVKSVWHPITQTG